MNKRGLVGLLILVVVIIVAGFFWFVNQQDPGEVEDAESCVPASCCHPAECVPESEAPDCNGTICTMNCEPGTLDCGQLRCEYVGGECGVVLNE